MANASILRERSCLQCGVGFMRRSSKGPAPNRCPPCADQRDRDSKCNFALSPPCACNRCGEIFTPKRSDRISYCSRSCAIAAKSEARSRWPNSRVRFPVCVTCASPFATRSSAKHCSDLCRAAKARDNARTSYALAHPTEARSCLWCQAPFVPSHGGRTTCSVACSRARAGAQPAAKVAKRSARLRRKALQRGATVELFDPVEILERDRWRCHLCGEKTPRKLRGTYDARAPEVDHIIPLSKGGEHSRRNTACACRACNLAKGDKPLGQLKLVA